MEKTKAQITQPHLGVAALLKIKPHISKKTGLRAHQVVRIIITFFGFIRYGMIKGDRCYVPGDGSFGIYRSEYVGKKLPPLSRNRFRGKVEYAHTPGRSKYKYNIIADAGAKYNKGKPEAHKIRLEASPKLKTLLHKILSTTTFEYPNNPWQ